MKKSATAWIKKFFHFTFFLLHSDFSPRQPAAVHVHDRAVHVIGVLRREKQDWFRDVFRLAPARFGNAGENGLVALLVLADRARVFRGDVAGRNGVEVAAFLGQLVGERLGDAGNAALAGGVA